MIPADHGVPRGTAHTNHTWLLRFVLLLSLAVSSEGRTSPAFRSVVAPRLAETLGAGRTGTRQLGVRAFMIPDIGWRSLAGGLRAQVKGWPTLRESAMPPLPFESRLIPTSAAESVEVEVRDEVWEESREALGLEIIPEPLVWGPSGFLPPADPPPGRFFPGQLVRVADTADGAVVRLYAMQWDRTLRRVLVLRRATLDFYTRPREMRHNVRDLWGAQALILVPRALAEGAARIQRVHRERWGVESRVVAIEEIARVVPPADESTFPEGLRNLPAQALGLRDLGETGYRYDLARRIAAYLRRWMPPHGNLKAVLLLGDARGIPPSYYFTVGTGSGRRQGVTDLCYGASEGCLIPRIAVGRLPFSTPEEVAAYAGKLERWIEWSSGVESELAVFAGKAFPGTLFTAETAILDSLNREGIGWRGVRKHLRSHRAFVPESVLALARGEVDSILAYYLDHGGGDRWHVDSRHVSARALRSADGRGAALPIVASISCSNAAFDGMLLDSPLFEGADRGEDSVGVTLLKSRTGPIAYLGSLRPALGVPLYRLDAHGNLETEGGTYALEFFGRLLDAYARREGRTLGDIYLAALRDYASGPTLPASPRHQWTLLNLGLLGDPLLPLPPRRRPVPDEELGRSRLAGLEAGHPLSPPFARLEKEGLLTLPVTGPAHARAAALAVPPIDGSDDVSLGAWATSEESSITLDLREASTVLVSLRSNGATARERQIWFRVAEKVTRP